jgi:polyisoprenoid-binding protein YceI
MKLKSPATHFLFLVLLAMGNEGFTQSYKPTDEGSSVQFKIKNFGSTVDGTFKGLEGVIEFDPAQPGNARFNVSVDANAVDTNSGLRDNHLRKKEYFDVKTYPRIRFVSTRVAAGAKTGEYVIIGNLTIKSTTKEISFPFTYSLMDGNPVFRGQFPLNRRDFSVGGGSLSLSDNLVVLLQIVTGK